MRELTPKEIVRELDKYIIGQDRAKRAVAIALRNRWRRLRAPAEMREEIIPNNILMIGPTGVGKTEIARRLAKLAQAPFIKVEASKFSEVGYVGRDVESMVRELMDIAVSLVKAEKAAELQEKAKSLAKEHLLDILIPPPKTDNEDELERISRSREKMAKLLEEGRLDERTVEIETRESVVSSVEIFTPAGLEEMGVNFQEMFDGMFPPKIKRRKLAVPEALKVLENEELSKLLDYEEVVEEAKRRVEDSGIIFIDEIDKIVGKGETHGPDVSREGVQRDLLPIIEGSNVMTKYGIVRTDHILFIAAGAFHSSRPSDLIPELQGRFPIRVELDSLTQKEFERILVEPQNSLVKQYKALLASEGVELEFTRDAIKEIARIAYEVNSRTENIGARRLHTVMTNLLDDLLYNSPDGLPGKRVVVTKRMVLTKLSAIVKDEDMTRYIL